jgi:5-methyltetrahydropteroyltriglutamate--homocysteine methyltransferase
VIDVKATEVEAPGLVASRIHRALEFVPADRLMVNPDCGLRHLPPDVARPNCARWWPAPGRSAAS